jgi:hypothetical protein
MVRIMDRKRKLHIISGLRFIEFSDDEIKSVMEMAKRKNMDSFDFMRSLVLAETFKEVAIQAIRRDREKKDAHI